MTITRSLLVLFVATAVVTATAGCGRVKEDKLAQGLYAATKGYRESIRWGYYDAALGFLHPDERVDVDLEALENIRVTGYEEIQPAVITPEETAVQLVRIDYVLRDEQRLKTLVDRQQWRWDDDLGAWWLYGGLPAFEQ